MEVTEIHTSYKLQKNMDESKVETFINLF